jgi:hypothetical protein
MAFRYEFCQPRRQLSQFNASRAMMWSSKEDEPKGGITDRGVFRIFVCIKEGLEQVVSLKFGY